MEFHVHPSGFGCVPAKLPTTTGGEVDAIRVILIDQQSGISVHAFFGVEQFAALKRFLEDPAAESARQQARSKIAVPTPSPPGNGPLKLQ